MSGEESSVGGAAAAASEGRNDVEEQLPSAEAPRREEDGDAPSSSNDLIGAGMPPPADEVAAAVEDEDDFVENGVVNLNLSPIRAERIGASDVNNAAAALADAENKAPPTPLRENPIEEDEDDFLDNGACNLSLSPIRAEKAGAASGVQIDIAEPIDEIKIVDDGMDVEKQAPATPPREVTDDTFVGIDDTFATSNGANGSFQSSGGRDGGRVEWQRSQQRKLFLGSGAVIFAILLFVAGYGVGESQNGESSAAREPHTPSSWWGTSAIAEEDQAAGEGDVMPPSEIADFASQQDVQAEQPLSLIPKGSGFRKPRQTPKPTVEPSPSPSEIPTSSPTTPSPSASPTTLQPTPAPFARFAFGEELYTTDDKYELQVSIGLSIKLVAETGKKVEYRNGDKSPIRFHGMMDGAGIVARPDGGYVYVSNSEEEDRKGGVYALYFDKQGNVVEYKALLTGTTRNCGGGLTPWGTWISCEEVEWEGQCWQVDPDRKSKHHDTPQVTQLGGSGGEYESVAVDDRKPNKPVFFVMEDHEQGALRRFEANGSGWDALHTEGRTTFLRFLDGNRFEWTTSEREGRASAEAHYRNSEGISYHDGRLYFVAKKAMRMFILDLDNMTYTSERTGGPNLKGRGDFNAQPDQLAMGMNKRYLYLTEDGGASPGAIVRDFDGNYYVILQGVPGGRYDDDETAGLALTPNRKRLYVGMQEAGLLFEVTRDDGQAFE